jgi:hypothetical protein
MSPLIFVLFMSAVLAAGLVWVILRLVANSRVTVDPKWLEAFSTDRYRPMLRLLSDDDNEFLLTNCGYSGSMIRRVRAERRRIFRAYLQNAVRDFNRIHHAARIMLLDSPVDRPDLAAMLTRQRIAFEANVLLVQYHLVLHGLGLAPVDVRGLIRLLDSVKVNYDLLAPAAAPSY